jgi:hypothetical protein
VTRGAEPGRVELGERVGSIDVSAALRGADREDKAALYGSLGMTLTFEPRKALVKVALKPWGLDRVGGGT